jgi:hypothetical protein
MADFNHDEDPPPEHIRRLLEDIERRKAEKAKSQAEGTGAPDKKRYDVGYGKPPKASQFKPGQSGNGKGRPAQNKRFQALVREVFDQKVRVTENGRTRKVPVSKLVLTQLSHKAAKGEDRATKEFLRLFERIQPITPEPVMSKEEMDEREAQAAKLKSVLIAGLEAMASAKKGADRPPVGGRAKPKPDDDDPDGGAALVPA